MLLAFAALALLAALAYVWLMGFYQRHWRRSPSWQVPPGYRPATPLWVIVPARNEAAQIAACLDSLLAQDYPAGLLHITVVDDHSEDATPDIVAAYAGRGVRLLRLAEHLAPGEQVRSFKKKAIEIAIRHIGGGLVATTDADCEMGPQWALHLASYHEVAGKAMIAAPVLFWRERSAFEGFQSLDFAGMMGITAAGIRSRQLYMCNGANFAYTKALYEAIGGFEGIDHMASGDDMFLMQKAQRQCPESIGFLKSPAAAVRTEGKPDWRSFAQQRLRWATKNGSYGHWRSTAMLGIAYLHCLFIVLSVLCLPFVGWQALWLLLAQMLLKSAADWPLLSSTSRYFGRADLLRHFALSELLHVAYIAGIGTWAQWAKEYEWKGRRLR